MKVFVFYFLILFTVFFTVFFSAFSYSEIYGKDVLRLGTDDWPPYEFAKKGEIKGFCTEILLAVLGKLNVTVSENRIYPWARAERMLSRGRIDALYSASRSSKRESMAFFPNEPLIISKWVFFVRVDELGRLKYDSFTDLKGKKIGVIRDYSYTPEFWDFINKEKNYETASEDKTLFKMLGSGRLRYVISEYKVGREIVKKLKLQKTVTHLKQPLKVTGLYIMFSKKNISEQFVRIFSEELRSFKKSHEYKRIFMKYF